MGVEWHMAWEWEGNTAGVFFSCCLYCVCVSASGFSLKVKKRLTLNCGFSFGSVGCRKGDGDFVVRFFPWDSVEVPIVFHRSGCCLMAFVYGK
jgi:hypothetical protein